MTVFKAIADVPVDAYQWSGDPRVTVEDFKAGKPPGGGEEIPPLSGVVIQPWITELALHVPGDGTLHVPVSRGTFRAAPGDWVVRFADGTLAIMPDSLIKTYFR